MKIKTKTLHIMFVLSFIFNLFAHLITHYGVQNRILVEVNPIQSHIQSFGFNFSMIFFAIFWCIVAVFYVKGIPKFEIRWDMSKIKLYSAFVIPMFIAFLIDFLNDFILIYLNTGGIII